MTLPPHLFAAAPRAPRLGIVIPFLVAIMVYLATLALAAQIAFGSATALWSDSLEGHATLEMRMDQDEGTSAKLNEALAVLRTLPDIESVTPVSHADIARLLKPWIDDPVLLTAMPLPQMIDIQLKQGHRIDAEALQSALAPFSKDVHVNWHDVWMAPLARLVRSLGLIAGFAVVVIAAAFMIAVMLVCRVAFAMQHETIELLHILGADDKAIAGHFQRQILLGSLLPSLLGFALALVTLGGLAALYVEVQSVPEAGLLTLPRAWLVMGGCLSAVPLAALGVAAFSARLSVLRMLRRMP